MGDRISIAFKDKEEQSVVLFSHWDGLSLKDEAEEFLEQMKKQSKDAELINVSSPLTRLEPHTLIVHFIKWLTVKGKLENELGNYYLGHDEDDGDNSDNGHFDIEIN